MLKVESYFTKSWLCPQFIEFLYELSQLLTVINDLLLKITPTCVNTMLTQSCLLLVMAFFFTTSMPLV
jgi:hypothetical protein